MAKKGDGREGGLFSRIRGKLEGKGAPPAHSADASRRIQRRLPGEDAPDVAPPQKMPAQSQKYRGGAQQLDGQQPIAWENFDNWNEPEAQPAPVRRAHKGRGDPAAPSAFTPRREKKQKMPKGAAGRGRRIVKGLVLAAVALCVLVAVGLGVMIASTTRNDDLWLNLDQIPYRTATTLYYTDKVTGEVGEYARIPSTQNKEYVEGAQIPQHLKDAFVAIEDKDFYRHGGVSVRRTIFAALNELKRALTGSYIGGEDGVRQGASTINQQLIKNLTRDDENSDMAGYLRKVREIWRALRMDANYEKETILNAYLNTISFTGNTAGVQAESKKLFGKSVEELTLAECASLAAITRNPYWYDPNENPENHLERRDYVLYEMREQEYITEEEYQQAVGTPLWVTGEGDPVRDETVNSYFTDLVQTQVVQQLVDSRNLTYGEATDLFYNGGLQIYTTVVPQLQENMEYVMENAALYPRTGQTAIKALTEEDGTPILDGDGQPVMGEVTVYPQAAMVSLNYEGGIAAVVGGLGEKEINLGFNRGTSAVRQVGSTMKPIGPYALGIDTGTIHWSTPFLDAPVRKEENKESGEMEDWPRNASGVYREEDVLVKDAFAQSINTVAVRVGDRVGNLHMYEFVRGQLGINTITSQDIDTGPLVLGSSTYGITPLDMAKAYAMFGNGGVVHDTYSFTRITNGPGDVYYEAQPFGQQVIGADTAYVMNRLMREVMVGYGTASGFSVGDGMDSVGKTGTTSDHLDHWFIGLTPYYVTASWYGYDENLPLGVNSHWNPPIIAWNEVMRNAQYNLPYAEFPVDETVEEIYYCTTSGHRAGDNCPAELGYYKRGFEPQGGCPIHG